VLFIGIGYCYLTTMLVIPALLGDRGSACKPAYYIAMDATKSSGEEGAEDKASEYPAKQRSES